MKITVFVIGKTTSSAIAEINEVYRKRINRYMKLEEVVIDNSQVKGTDLHKIKEKEGEWLLKKVTTHDYLILLDDKGTAYTSVQFSQYLEANFNKGIKNLCFAVGGAYGFSEQVYARANAKLSLSKMTFSHQIIRAIFYEQLYRGFTIMRNEPYHHE